VDRGEDPQARILAPGRPFRLLSETLIRYRRVNTPKRSPVRLPAVRSLSILVFVLYGFVTAVAATAAPVTGTIVDPSGRPLPRVLVTIVDASGNTVDATFTYPDGTFRLDRLDKDASAGCRIQASLAGFQTAVVDCGNGRDLRVGLAVAPVQEAVVVSATRTEAPLAQLATSVTVFTADDIARRQNPPLMDLLRTAPGAVVVANGSRGAVASLFIRGGESNYTKVLLDGIPLNEPGGTFDFGNVTTENMDRVELVRGAQSALFGSDAMAGVVQMFTARAPAGGPRAGVMVEGGTFGTARASASASGRAGDLDYSIGAARLSTNNEEANNEFDNTTLSGSAGLSLGTATLRFTGRAELGRVGTPGQTAFGRADLDAFFQRRNGVGGVTFTQTLTPSFTQHATYALSVSHQTSTNLVTDAPYTPSFDGRTSPFEFFDFGWDSHNELRRHYATYQADWRLPRASSAIGTHLLTAALDWDGERGVLEDRLAETSTRATRNNVGWTLQDQALWARVFVTGGLRIEHNDSFGTAVVPRGSVAYTAHQSTGTLGDTKLKASAGLGIKEPTLLQSFSLSPFALGNPALEPERSRSVEVGLEQRLLNERAHVELTWFANRYQDIISTSVITFDPFTSQYFNIGLTRARGGELSGELAPMKGVLVRAGYTRLDSKIIRSTSSFSELFAPGQALFRRPRHSGFVGFAWTKARLSADVTGVFVGRRVDSDFSALEPPIVSNDGYATWDVRAAYRVAGPLSITGAADNLTGTDYMDPLGYPALGRAFRIGARVGF
jgi:vitamin B12 transporter